MLEHESDLFQLKADFVAFPSGLISILVHIPVVDSSTKLKLYKFVGTPTFNNKYQFLVDSKEKYLAVNQDSTLYTVLDDLEKCESMRDVNICNDVNILHKAGSSQNCLFNLFTNNLEGAAKTCQYRIQNAQNFAVRLSDKEVFLFTPNKTVLTTKCMKDTVPTNMYAQCPNILTIDPGCRVYSANFVFKRNKQMFTKDISAVFIGFASCLYVEVIV